MSEPVSPSNSPQEPQKMQHDQEKFNMQPLGEKADAAFTASLQEVMQAIIGPALEAKDNL